MIRHKFNVVAAFKESMAEIRRYRELKESLDKFLDKEQPKIKKSVYEMSSDEFYDHITGPAAEEIAPQEFYQFLLDYILTAYLTGRMEDVDFKKLMALDNPLKVNRYVDRMVRNVHQQGTLLEELLRYQDNPEKSDALYSLILPDYAYDRQTKKVTVNSFNDLKAIVKDSTEELQKQKKLLSLARMQEEEQKRQDDYRAMALANAPEIAELIGADTFQSEAQELAHDSKILNKELEKQKKGMVIRAAQAPDHQVRSGEEDLSPSELIKLKEQLLEKLRNDMNGPQETGGGMTIRI